MNLNYRSCRTSIPRKRRGKHTHTHRNSGMHESCKVSKKKTSVFGFNDQLTMVSYVSKKNKDVILLSTMHHGISIVEEDPKKRPEIIKFYNETKVGVDLADQMVQTYTNKRQNCRWPLILFYNMLDIWTSAGNLQTLNGYTVFRQVYPNYLSGHCSRRQRFIIDLAESLIKPHMMTRQKIPQLHKAAKEAMMRCGLGLSSTSLQTGITLQKKKQCFLCPPSKDRKVAKCCLTCCRSVCPEHSQTSNPASHATNAMNELGIHMQYCELRSNSLFSLATSLFCSLYFFVAVLCFILHVLAIKLIQTW